MKSRMKSCEKKQMEHGVGVDRGKIVLIGILLLVLGLVPTFVGCRTKPEEPVDVKTKLRVDSVYVDKGPELDGIGSDEVWNKAPESKIPTSKGIDAKLRVVYTEEMIFFRISWEDKTPKNGALYWEYDGENWQRTYEDDDKVAFLWDIDHSIKGFETKGCWAVCHKHASDNENHMFLEGPNIDGELWSGATQKGDAWKWAPGVMNIVEVVDDGIFAADQDVIDHPSLSSLTSITLKFDNGDSGTKQWWTRNPNAASEEEKAQGIKKPALMLKPGTELDENSFPNEKDMTPIIDYSVFKAGDRIPLLMFFNLESEKNLNDFPDGRPSGSRVDLKGKGVFEDVTYTLEFGRKLNTGNDDDVQFKPKANNAVAGNIFALAIFDDTRFDHSISDPVTLVLEPKDEE